MCKVSSSQTFKFQRQVKLGAGVIIRIDCKVELPTF